MKVLIVATNEAVPNLQQDVHASIHPRVDYLELARCLNTTYVDYSTVVSSRSMGWLEHASRMDIRLAQFVSRAVEREGYDVVLSLSERVGLPLTRMLSQQVRHVVIMHHPMSYLKIRMMKLLDVAHHWSKIITISRAEAESLKEALRLPENLVTALLTPVDTDFYHPRYANVPLRQQDHIQSLGLSHRDYPTLIRAMRKLPDIPCHLRVGSTWVNHKAGHEDEVLPPNIELKSFVPPVALREAYAHSRFIVVPIKNDTQWSAGCTSVQIAQAMGKAVIASDRPGLANYVADGEDGILVRTGDENDMRDAIEYLWRNPEKAAQMGEKGRARVEESHALEKWLGKISRILADTAACALIMLFAMVNDTSEVAGLLESSVFV